MDSLPDHLIIEILNRLNDSIELTRCKLVSKTLYTLASQARSIHLYCTLNRYNKLRSPAEIRLKVTPFKTIFDKLIAEAQVPIESVSIGVDELVDCPLHCDYDLEEENENLLLTAGHFSDGWLTKIGDGLKFIEIEDFWAQSCVRETNILEVISCHCHNLAELTLKNVWSSADNMRLMPCLRRLTLKYVVLFDKNLEKLMECLPFLEVLNLIDSCGGADTKIHHLNLKELRWTLSFCAGDPDISSITVFAPNLTKLELKCDDIITLSIHAPLLSYFHLALEGADVLDVEKFMNLKTLSLVSSELYYILLTLPISITVQSLTLDSPKCGPVNERIKFSLLKVCTVFPNVTSLTLGSEVWSQQMVDTSSMAKGWRARNKMKRLKQITVYLVLDDIDRSHRTLSFVLYVAGICIHLTDIVLFIHRDVDLSVAINFVASCMSQCSKVRWRWGTWKKEPFHLK